jgi:VanZ family protein
MNPVDMAAGCSRLTLSKIHVVLPLFLTAALYWLSSLPGTPLPEDPSVYSPFYWLPPIILNALHVPAYAALTLAWHLALRAWLRDPGSVAFGAFVIALTCGILNEWHQSYVPNRFASVGDVALNVAGVALGTGLAHWLGSRAQTLKRPIDSNKTDPGM